MKFLARLFRRPSPPPIPISECSNLLVGWLKRRLDKNELLQLAELADLQIESLDDEFFITEEALTFYVAFAEQFFPRTMSDQSDSSRIIAGFLDRVAPVVAQFNSRKAGFEMRYLKKRDDYKVAFAGEDAVLGAGLLFSRDFRRGPGSRPLNSLAQTSLGVALMQTEEQLKVMARQFEALTIDRSKS